MFEKIKVAAVQAAPCYMDLTAGVDKAVQYIEEAARAGVKLIVFPETWLPGYPNHVWLGPVSWSAQFTRPYFESSVEEGSETDKAIAEAARKNRIQVSMGLSEREGGSLYISQWHYDESGNIIQRRRKLKPTHVERTVYGEGDGSDLVVNETSIGRVGQLSCWEHLQPLSKYAMYSQNEQIHCAAWPNYALYEGIVHTLGAEVNTAVSRVYAVEGSCFVIAACATVSEELRDLLCQGDPEKEKLLRVGGGFTRIYGPDGRSLAPELAETEEGLVMAEIDLGEISLAKSAADPAGHYARRDVTRLLLNPHRQRPVMHFGVPGDAVIVDAVQPIHAQEFEDAAE
jgi:nitrilase